MARIPLYMLRATFTAYVDDLPDDLYDVFITSTERDLDVDTMRVAFDWLMENDYEPGCDWKVRGVPFRRGNAMVTRTPPIDTIFIPEIFVGFDDSLMDEQVRMFSLREAFFDARLIHNRSIALIRFIPKANGRVDEIEVENYKLTRIKR